MKRLIPIFALLFLGLATPSFARPHPAADNVDLIVSGGTVVTMDAAGRVIEDGAVAVKGDAIVAAGPRAEIEARYHAVKTIDARGTIVMPGTAGATSFQSVPNFAALPMGMACTDWPTFTPIGKT